MAVSTGGVPRYRQWHGIAIFSQGFRPFFFGAGVFAVAGVGAWLFVLTGIVQIPSQYPSLAWHAHEMIFGFVSAVIAGFLLTAIPNWTGRLPLQGWPLILLFVTWVAGRMAMIGGGLLGAPAAAIVDGSFLVVLLSVSLREILAGKNWRNLPICVAIWLLASANVLSHLEALDLLDLSGAGNRLGIAVVIGLITLIGGRVVPSFTNTWLAKRNGDRRSQMTTPMDRAVLGIGFAALVSWAFLPDHRISGLALVVAGAGNMLRLARWRGMHTHAEPLIWSLHLGFLWVPVGLLLLGASALVTDIPMSAGMHALTAGAIGSMTVAVMTRAILGHTGRTLSADGATFVIYVLIFLAAVIRVGAPFSVQSYEMMIVLSALLWCGGFSVFTLRYGAILWQR